MPSYEFYIYSNTVLAYNGGTGAFDFSAGYDYSTGRYKVVVNDDDSTMNASSDANQTAQVYDMNGNLIDSGTIYVPAYAEIDVGGTSAYLDRIEVNGTHYGYLPSEPLTPGSSYPMTYSGTYEEQHSYYEIFSVACFDPATQITTRQGDIPIEWLVEGDQVLTRDRGFQPVRSILRFSADRAERARRADLGMFRIEAGAFGANQPNAPLFLSRQHRVLMSGAQVELHFGVDEALCPIHALSGGTSTQDGEPLIRRYAHLVFDNHEIIMANGLWVESLFLADIGRYPVPAPQIRQVNHMSTARLCLTAHEARVLPCPSVTEVVIGRAALKAA